MSIVTKTGDQGLTSLMYGKRVPKTHPHVEACGTVDELNATLGLARAAAREPALGDTVLAVQKDLVTLMGELSASPEDAARYAGDGYPLVTGAMTSRLESLIARIEPEISLRDWATPGANELAAALDLARTVCRRSERRVCELQQSGSLRNPEIVVYLNRLADLLWLLARQAEKSSKCG